MARRPEPQPSATADSWTVPAPASGHRLDRHLAERYGVPRNRVQGWIRAGEVQVGERPAKASRILIVGEAIACRPLPAAGSQEMEPEPGLLDLIHEDEDILVVAKPAGLAVHPGAGRTRGTLANRLLAAYPEMATVGGPGRPGIVHRLDKGTTGLLILARTDRAYLQLSEDFAARRIGKLYLALVYGKPAPPAGRIDRPIGRHPQKRKEMTVAGTGRPAVSDYRTLGCGGPISLLEIGLLTGRTHQIRVHLKAAGHPLVGDPVYGEARWKGLPKAIETPLRRFGRPALHAWRLSFDHPTRGERLELEAPIPADLTELWRDATSGQDLARLVEADPPTAPG